jgi:hypothetical protein
VSPCFRCEAALFFSRSPRLPMEASTRSKAASEETARRDVPAYFAFKVWVSSHTFVYWLGAAASFNVPTATTTLPSSFRASAT